MAIASNTITADKIRAGAVTAEKLDVTELSAISGNLGTVNAGTINGVTINSVTINGPTINAGPNGAIVIDGDGISIPDGTSVSGYRITLGGAEIWGVNAGSIYMSAGLFAYGQIGTDSNVFAQGNLIAGGSLFCNPPTDPAGSYDLLMLNTSDNQVHRATGGYTGSFLDANSNIVNVSRGVITSVD